MSKPTLYQLPITGNWIAPACVLSISYLPSDKAADGSGFGHRVAIDIKGVCHFLLCESAEHAIRVRDEMAHAVMRAIAEAS